jgi:hypothetical protein
MCIRKELLGYFVNELGLHRMKKKKRRTKNNEITRKLGMKSE